MEIQERFFWGTLLGTAIGAMAALIFTPLSGEKMRQKIVNEMQGRSHKSWRHNRRGAKRRSGLNVHALQNAGSHRKHKEKKASQRVELKHSKPVGSVVKEQTKSV